MIFISRHSTRRIVYKPRFSQKLNVDNFLWNLHSNMRLKSTMLFCEIFGLCRMGMLMVIFQRNCVCTHVCSHSHPAIVCLCGRLVNDNLQTLLDRNKEHIFIEKWQPFAARALHNSIYSYPTFLSMMRSLEEREDAVELLRRRFCGFLEDVTLPIIDVPVADFLISQGVLIKRGVTGNTYCMASPIIDSFIRSRVIPKTFPLAPSG